MNKLKINTPFPLESGALLPELEIAYHTYGTINEAGDNVIWVCHALTANSDVADWWPGLFGSGKLIDPKDYFIVCANMLGSCYGSTNPLSINPETKEPYRDAFPLITIRDMVNAHELLRAHLKINQIQLLIGGSMGGQQALEWAVIESGLIKRLCVLATNALHSPWGIAFNEAQRMALLADPTLYQDVPEAGKKGLEAARAIAMLSYRNYRTYQHTQSEEILDKIEDFKASSYQRYQGLKLHKRFNALSYLTLSKAMDSHNLGRERGSVEAALEQIETPTLVIGIQSDVLFPIEEQHFLAKHIPKASFEWIDSMYGHDGFLIEFEAITKLVAPFLANQINWDKKQNLPLNGIGKLALPGTEKF